MASNSRDVDSPLLALIAEQLRAEAARQRMSLRDVARNSGIPYPTVQKSFAGRRMIDVAELGAFCYALGLDPSELFARIEPPPSHPAEAAG